MKDIEQRFSDIEMRIERLEESVFGDDGVPQRSEVECLAKSGDKYCPYCGLDTRIANPSGNCSHIYYPDNVNKSLKPKPTPTPEVNEVLCNTCFYICKKDKTNCMYYKHASIQKPSVEKCETITISRKVAVGYVRQFENKSREDKDYEQIIYNELKLALSNINGKGE